MQNQEEKDRGKRSLAPIQITSISLWKSYSRIYPTKHEMQQD